MLSTQPPNLARYLVTLPDFALYFLVAMILLMAFLIVYTRLTPQREWHLIREGNTAAAISLGGALLGFAIPLAAAITNSLNLADTAIWGGVALVIQWGVFLAARSLIPGLPERIAKGETAAAVAAASFSMAVGLLNAACMTY